MKKYNKTVCLHYTNGEHRGPGKVVTNLTKGLNILGVDVSINDPKLLADHHGVLQQISTDIFTKLYVDGRDPLMGPNLFVLPSDSPGLCYRFKRFIVPSAWTKALYGSFNEMREKNISVWTVGIKTDVWKPVHEKTEDLDCFIYYKNRSKQDLELVKALCKKFELKYEILEYGFYQEEKLFSLCQKAKFAILLTGTESQGIGYMQILSTNTPCYVFNSSTWKSDNGKVECPATSVPYFDNRCGHIDKGLSIEHFSDFISISDSFKPREYILQNHTLQKSAETYYNLLQV